jgi:hypothetical protein
LIFYHLLFLCLSVDVFVLCLPVIVGLCYVCLWMCVWYNLKLSTFSSDKELVMNAAQGIQRL